MQEPENLMRNRTLAAQGQSLVEYAVIGAVVVVVALVGLNLLGGSLETRYDGLSQSLVDGNGSNNKQQNRF